MTAGLNRKREHKISAISKLSSHLVFRSDAVNSDPTLTEYRNKIKIIAVHFAHGDKYKYTFTS